VKAAAVRLAIAGALFTVWIGYLAYLAAFTRDPVILSRPQFRASSYDVVGRVVPDDPTTVHVEAVLYLAPGGKESDEPAVTPDQVITVDNLADCRVPDAVRPARDWPAPAPGGVYLIPLSRKDGGKGDPAHPHFTVAAVPPSPGFFPDSAAPLRVYPDGPETRKEYAALRKAP